MTDSEGGFWLVSQAARVLNDLLCAVHFRADKDVIDLWANTRDWRGNNCRAFYRFSENAIYVIWG
jgi:hypothetical protein